MLGSLVTWNRVVECQSADRQRIGAGRVAQLVEDSYSVTKALDLILRTS